MKALQLGMLLGALARCSNSTHPGRTPAGANRTMPTLESRESMFSGAGWLLDVRVTGDEGPFAIASFDDGAYTTEGTVWSATVSAQLISRGIYAAPARIVLYLQRSRTHVQSRQTSPVDMTRLQGLTQLQRDTRYLVALTRPLHSTPSGTIVMGYYFRVDANGRLLDRALEFPAGTPVSVVLDASTMPRELLGDLDASAPSDGAASGD